MLVCSGEKVDPICANNYVIIFYFLQGNKKKKHASSSTPVQRNRSHERER